MESRIPAHPSPCRPVPLSHNLDALSWVRLWVLLSWVLPWCSRCSGQVSLHATWWVIHRQSRCQVAETKLTCPCCSGVRGLFGCDRIRERVDAVQPGGGGGCGLSRQAHKVNKTFLEKDNQENMCLRGR